MMEERPLATTGYKGRIRAGKTNTHSSCNNRKQSKAKAGTATSVAARGQWARKNKKNSIRAGAEGASVAAG